MQPVDTSVSPRSSVRYEVPALRGFVWALAAAIVVFGNLATLPFVLGSGPLAVLSRSAWIGIALAFCVAGYMSARELGGNGASREVVARFWIRRFFAIAPLFFVLVALWLVYGAVNGATFAPQTLALNFMLAFNLVLGVQDSLVAGGWAIGVLTVFYLIAPLLSLCITGVRSALVGLVFALLLSSAFFDALQPTSTISPSFASSFFLTWLPYFCAGVLAFHVATSVRPRPAQFAPSLLASGLAIALVALTPPMQDLFASLRVSERLVWSAVLFLIVLASVGAGDALEPSRWRQEIPNLSYGAYLIHPLVLQVFVVAASPTIATLGLSATKSFALAGALVLPVILVLSIVALAVVQLPGIRLGRVVALRIRTEPGATADEGGDPSHTQAGIATAITRP